MMSKWQHYSPGAANMSMRLGREDVRAKLRDPKRFLLDLRSPEDAAGQGAVEA